VGLVAGIECGSRIAARSPATSITGVEPALPYISTEDCTGISTGQHEIDRCIGDGIPRGSLTLIEGKHAAGKTVLCQNLAYSVLQNKSSVAFYTSETSSPSMISRMSSLGLDVLDYFLLDKLRIFPIELTKFYPAPDELLVSLLEHMTALPTEFNLIAVDTLTSYLPRCSKSTILDFFVECRQMCSQGKTIVITLDSRRSLSQLAAELQPLFDVHLKLKMEAVLVEKVVKVLKVAKSTQGSSSTPKKVHFDVLDGVGIHTVFPK